jgi:hypothetical protein
MALVAFDLDNTLGCFYPIAPVADWLSPDCIENPVQQTVNQSAARPLSPALKKRLEAAEQRFFERIAAQPDVVDVLLRPNVGAMIRPIIKAKEAGRVRAVCIYSNTWIGMTMRLAKYLIERKFGAPGLFDALVDATHPIRKEDWAQFQSGEPLKTYPTLRRIFREICDVKGVIRPTDVIFVDERPTRHAIQADVRNGLTYLQPTVYAPRFSAASKSAIRDTLTLVLHETGLLKDSEYMKSCVFQRVKLMYSFHRVPIRTFTDLMNHTFTEIETADSDTVPFRNDSGPIRQQLVPFLQRF